MRLKNQKGFTLVELLLTLAILAVVTAAAGSALFSAFSSYALSARLQEFQYEARLSLLGISREIHRGTDSVSIGTDANGNSILTLNMHDGTAQITYSIDNNGMLVREINPNIGIGTSPIPFISVAMDRFTVTPDPDLGDRRLYITIEKNVGLNNDTEKLDTVVSRSRVPGDMSLN